jgi:hypothetical protein
MVIRCLLLAVLTTASLAEELATAEWQAAAKTATVCELLRHASLRWKVVVVDATFVGGLLEHTSLLDGSCKECGGISTQDDEEHGAIGRDSTEDSRRKGDL